MSLKNSTDQGLFENTNAIDLPIRGSIRGSIRPSFSLLSNAKLPPNPNKQQIQSFGNQNNYNPMPADASPRKLANVEENDDTLMQEESGNEEEGDDESFSEENREKEAIKLAPCITTHEEINHSENHERKQSERHSIEKEGTERNSLINGSVTERESKGMDSSTSLKKIFIPSLKNTTNSCNFE